MDHLQNMAIGKNYWTPIATRILEQMLIKQFYHETNLRCGSEASSSAFAVHYEGTLGYTNSHF